MTAEQVGCESIRRQCIRHRSWLKGSWRLGAKSEYTRAQLDNPRMVIFAKVGLKVSHSIARIHTISNVSHYTRHRKSQDRLAGLDVWGIRGLLPPCCSMPSMIS